MISVGCVLGMHIRSGSGKGVLQKLFKLLEYDFCWMCIACAYVVEVERVSYKYYLFLFIRTRTSYEIPSKVLNKYLL